MQEQFHAAIEKWIINPLLDAIELFDKMGGFLIK